MRWVAAVVIAMLLPAPTPARSGQVPYRSAESMGADSPFVLRGEVSSVRSFWNDNRSRILTEVLVIVSERYKGAAPAEVRIVQMGGVLDGVLMNVAGSLEWTPGEEVVVFLQDSLPGRYQVAGFTQGKFAVQRDARSGREYAVQADLGNAELVGATRVPTSGRMLLDDLIAEALPEVEVGQ
jgi:hypothetical protein